MKIGYARVSTQDQNLNRQLDQLRQEGCERIYEEKISGKNKDRPELQRMLDALRRGDIVIISELTRGLLNCAKERLKIQEYVKLENLLAKYPELETAYNLKERFRKIYYSSTREVAEMFFAEWEEDIPERMTEFLSVAQTVHNWFEEIFNFFDDNYTNAMSESINNLIKAAQKQGRGYSFEILRAKMLYDNMCVRKPKYFKKPDNAMSYMTYMTLNQKPEMISGYMVDIDMLTKWLESDDF